VPAQIDDSQAVDVLGSLAQITRLAAFRHLVAVLPGSLPAGEIARLCDVPHNTMSTHLSILSRAGLIKVERDGRAMNYRANIASLRELIGFLMRDCCAGRPEFCDDLSRFLSDTTPDDGPERVMTPAFNVLFLCTHNSARSIMAEAVLEKIGKQKFRAYSAGSEPGKRPLPDVVGRLKVLGHDVSKLRCKSWQEFTGPDAPRMDFVIGLCDTLHGQFCPDGGEPFITAAWPLPDPAKFTGSESERTTLLNELYGMIRRRIEIFTSLPFARLDKLALRARLDQIGDSTPSTR
jgi:arsenate reductase